jgi:hypothetical protein
LDTHIFCLFLGTQDLSEPLGLAVQVALGRLMFFAQALKLGRAVLGVFLAPPGLFGLAPLTLFLEPLLFFETTPCLFFFLQSALCGTGDIIASPTNGVGFYSAFSTLTFFKLLFGLLGRLLLWRLRTREGGKSLSAYGSPWVRGGGMTRNLPYCRRVSCVMSASLKRRHHVY